MIVSAQLSGARGGDDAAVDEKAGPAIYAGLYIVAFAVLAWLSWYRPYLRGSTPAREASAAHEYGRTVQVLPPRANRIRPNLMHVILHLLSLAVAACAVGRFFAS